MFCDDKSRKTQRKRKHPEFVRQSKLTAQVFKIKDGAARQRFEQRLQVGLFDELARGDDRAYARRNTRTFHRQRAGRIIQDRRHPARRGQRHDHRDRSHQVRQQDANILSIVRVPPKQTRQREAHAQNITVTVRLVSLVFHEQGPAPVHRDGVQEALEKRLADMALRCHRLHDSAEPARGERAPPARAACRPAVNACGSHDPQRSGWPPPAQPGGRSGATEPLPCPLDMHWQHPGTAFQRNQRGYRVDFHHRTVVDDTSLGKKHNRTPRTQKTQHAFHACRIAQVQRFVATMRVQPARQKTAGLTGRHNDHRIAWQKKRQHQGIQTRMMVRDNQQALILLEGRQIADNPHPQEITNQEADQRQHRLEDDQVETMASYGVGAKFPPTTQTRSITWAPILNQFLRSRNRAHQTRLCRPGLVERADPTKLMAARKNVQLAKSIPQVERES